MGFDWIWFRALADRPGSAARVAPQRRMAQGIPSDVAGLRAEDIAVPLPFAIHRLRVASWARGDAALALARERLRTRGLRLMPISCPNHMRRIIPGSTAPGLLCHGSDSIWPMRRRITAEWKRLTACDGSRPVLRGMARYLQLDYGNPATQEAMIGELLRVAGQCDGVRCDMAMLVLPDVFERTWGRRAPLFWPESDPRRAASALPAFASWPRSTGISNGPCSSRASITRRQAALRRLREGHARPVRAHFHAALGLPGQARPLHGEPRRAARRRDLPAGNARSRRCHHVSVARPAFLPSGPVRGRKTRVSPHLVRAPQEPVDEALQRFYRPCSPCSRDPVVRDGDWRLVDCVPAWEGTGTSECFIAWWWQTADRSAAARRRQLRRKPEPMLPSASRCRPLRRTVRLEDRMGPPATIVPATSSRARGLYLDMLPWGYQLFRATSVDGKKLGTFR